MATDNTSKRPTHHLFAVTKRPGSDKGSWTQIGAAWPNADGKGFNIKLDLIPVNGADIVMREPQTEGDAK
jgi:hypothetical protein